MPPAPAVSHGWVCSDDLRLYGWVQFVPLITIAALFILFPGRYTQRTYLLLGLAFYLFAKGAEYYDVAIYALTGETIGGHAIKHLLAAGGPLWIYFMLRRRRAVSA